MSRESLARATNSRNLEMEPGHTHDVDRLAAAATGHTLGGLLLRVREAGQARWARRIVLILTNRVRDKHKLSRALAEKCAMVALAEFLSPNCSVCDGAREIALKVDGPVEKGRTPTIVCDACSGTGLQRFSNESRRAAIGTYGARIDSAVSDAHEHMVSAISAYTHHADERLG